MRIDIYDLLRNEFKLFENVIDVGCAGLHDLVNFENSPFKKIIGIDNNFLTNEFGDYRRIKLNGLQLSDEEFTKRSSELYQQFSQRFLIYTMNFLDYDFGYSVNSFIICNKVLHFYSDEKKREIIKIFFDSLAKEGLLFLKINHFRHPDNTDLKKVKRIGNFIYQNKEVREDVRYLIDPSKFITELRREYELLDKYLDIDDKTVTLVIRK